LSGILQGVLPDELPDIWPHVEPLISEACQTSSGRYLSLDVLQNVQSEVWQLWLARRDTGGDILAVIVTSISVYPQIRALRIRIVTGDEREVWQGCIGELEQWGRDMGCCLVEGEARPGWARIAKKFGYRHTHSILEKDI